jgi:hypothetical protein
MVASDPAGAAGGDEHEADAVVESELQWFRYTILRWLADGVEAEPLTVERERGRAIGDRQADDHR